MSTSEPRMIDLFTVDFDGLSNEQRYSAIVEFARAQPGESNRHDFKAIWADDTVKDVAAFANSFGGVLVIGVRKGQKDVEASVGGVPSSSEIATGIASSIATNISPTPSFDIMECHKPGDANTKFCVVRVRSDSTIHLVTKKSISQPVWVRNADETIPADAAVLRRMIDREKQTTEKTHQSLARRVKALFDGMVVGYGYRAAGSENWPAGNWTASPTALKLALIPTENKVMTLGQREEEKFVALIHDNYRRVRSTLGGASKDAPSRSADYYEYRWYHTNLDYEARWRITTSLDLAHATQIRQDQNWSLADVAFYTILLLKVGAEWWESLGYFGDSALFADLGVGVFKPAQGRSSQFLTALNPLRGDFAIRGETVALHPEQRESAHAGLALTMPEMRDGLPHTVTMLMNSLLRTLGHTVLLDEFEDDIRTIVRQIG